MVTVKRAPKPRMLSCRDLTDEQDALARNILARICGSWNLWILHVMYDEAAPLRFSRIAERVEGITQKVLTQSLRALERDGLVTRTVFPEVPPRVEYALTTLGRNVLGRTLPLWNWMVTQVPKLEKARAIYDERSTRSRTPPAAPRR